MSRRIRSIKPEILDDERTAALSHGAWRLFVSLWLLADDYGNFRAVPRQIGGAVFWGRDDSDAGAWLDELTSCGLVKTYRVKGQHYAHISGWHHQKVDKPGKPLCPGPELADDSEPVATHSRESRESPAKVSNDDGKPPETLAPDRDLDQDPDQEEDQDQTPKPPSGSALVLSGGSRVPDKPSRVSPHDADAAAAYAHWREQHTRADPALDRKSRGYRHALKQLQKGRTLQDLRAAIDGCHASDWNRENHKDSFEFIMREDQFLAFMERGYAPNKPKGWVAQTQQFLDDQLDNLEAQHAG